MLLHAGHDRSERRAPRPSAPRVAACGCVAALLKAGARPDASDDAGVAPIPELPVGVSSFEALRVFRRPPLPAPVPRGCSRPALRAAVRPPARHPPAAAGGATRRRRRRSRRDARGGGDVQRAHACRRRRPNTPPCRCAARLHYAVGSTWAVRAGAQRVRGPAARRGAEPNARDVNGDTALHVALASAAEGARARAFVALLRIARRAGGGRRLLGCLTCARASPARPAAPQAPLIARLIAAGASAATRNDAGERPCDLASWLKAPFAKALCEVAALGSTPLPDDYGRPSERARDF